MFARQLIPILAALMFLPGCVAKKKYVALEDELSSTRAAKDAEIAALESQLADAHSQQETTNAALNDTAATAKALQDEVTRLQTEQAELQSHLADTLKDKSALKASVEEMQSALAATAKQRAEAEKRIAQFQDLTNRFKALIDAGTLQIRIVDGRMVVQLSSDILFASGSAKLSDAGKDSIRQVSEVLASMQQRQFQIEGHTDNVPISTREYASNWELGFARALSVVKTMEEAGMPADRMSAASFGEQKPAASNDTPEGKAANRRIQIVLMPDLTSLPGFDELQQLTKPKG